VAVMKMECIVNSIEPLRLPGVNRIQANCKKAEIILEIHEEVYNLNSNDHIIIDLTKNKDECIKNYDLCCTGNVVSVNPINDISRVVLSIGGLLLIIKTKDKKIIKNIKIMDKYYIGIKRVAK